MADRSAERTAGPNGDDYSLWTVDHFIPGPAVAVPLYPSPTRECISLDGMWQVRIDPDDRGIAERWFEREDAAFDHHVNVPGTWNAQGLGGAGLPHDEGVRNPEWSLRSATFKGSYVGLAWYRKRVSIPAGWRDRRIRLICGGVLSSVRVWVNGQFAGGRWTDGNSFYVDITRHVRPGEVNTCVMAIDNRWKQTATLSHLNWYVVAGGPFHHIVLTALPQLHIEQAVVRPLLPSGSRSGIAEVHLSVSHNADSQTVAHLEIASLQATNRRFRAAAQISLRAGQTGHVVVPVTIDPVELWSPEEPNLYTLTVEMSGGGLTDRTVDRFGLRTVASAGNRFALNGRPVFLLGQHLNFFWPQTLTPPITKDEYIKHLKLMKEYGFNYLRTPWLMPEECYQAADELGMMLQLEFPYAFDEYTKIKAPLIERLIAECLAAYGNHPSLVVLCMSNEGSWDGRGDLNPRFCAFSKSIDPTRVVIDTDGMPEGGDATYTDIVSVHNMSAVWSDYMTQVARQTNLAHLRPCIDHEFLNVPTLCNPDDDTGYHGAIVAPPAECAARREHIRDQGMEAEYSRYVKASYHHQANFIKEGMERSRKNPAKAGYSMCAWNDIGPSIRWGLLDQRMNPKGITAEEMRRYNTQSVLLFDFVRSGSDEIELVPDYCRICEQPFTVQPCVSYFNHHPVTNATLTWWVETHSGATLAQGGVEHINLALSTVTLLPRIVIGPLARSKPQGVTLRMRLSGPEVPLENAWPLWLFPRVRREDVKRTVFASQNVIAALRRVSNAVMPPGDREEGDTDTDSLWVTDEGGLVLDWLRAGRTVLFLATGGTSSTASSPNVNPFDPGWFQGDGHMGSIIRPNPILGDFPHDGHASWQFRNLIEKGANVPEGPIAATCVISSVFGDNHPRVQHQLFMVNTLTGGHLTYCLLKVTSGRCEADYLLQQFVQQIRRVDADPVMTDEELRRHL
ncbi:MAG: hypothetical protein HY710_13090 [Candidatus Latescibacteria bacterium]|nr:hypothetical protein [Candidatus Latescibacterota bacterium]